MKIEEFTQLCKDLEHFETPEWAAKAILRAEFVGNQIVDPCAGSGILARACLDADCGLVQQWDIYKWGDHIQGILDFTDKQAMQDIDLQGYTVFMNPPFSKAVEFVEAAIPRAHSSATFTSRYLKRRKLMSKPWNPEAIKLLIELFERDKTVSAQKMSNIINEKLKPDFYSRSAVIAKLSRMGIYKKPSTQFKKFQRTQTFFRLENKSVDNPILNIIEKRSKHGVDMRDLDSETCRWPLGDPREAGFHFCGCMVTDGSIYCSAHHSRAYTPAKPINVHASLY